MDNITYITSIYEKTKLDDLANIRKCLFNQTNQNWIWCIYDDNDSCLTNDSLDYAKSIADEIKIFFLEHEKTKNKKGSASAKKIAFEKALEKINREKSLYLCELDHDDLISNDCNEILIKTINYCEPDFIHANTIVLNDPLTPAITGYCDIKEFEHPLYGYKDKGDCVFALLRYINIINKNITMNIRCYNRDFFINIGGFRDISEFGEDFDILFRILLSKNSKICYIDKELYFYNFNSNCSSKQIDCEEFFEKIKNQNSNIIESVKNKSFFIDEISCVNNSEIIIYHNE